MTWVRIEPDAPNHPKVQRAGLTAFGFMVASICYCNRYLTDGVIPSASLLALFPGSSPRLCRALAAQLVASGLWEAAEDGWRIHDFHRYQPTREEVLADRAAQHNYHAAGGRARASAAARIAGRFTSMSPAGEPAGHQQTAGKPLGPAAVPLTSMSPAPIRSDPIRSVETTEATTRPQRTKGNRAVLSDADFLTALKANPAYQGIDIDRAMSKLDAWLLTPKGRGKQKTQARMLYWLNGEERTNGAAPTTRRSVNDIWAGRPGGEVKI